jgi:predicted Zn-dependent peptidase
MSSRLFSVVREQHGLAYYIKTDQSPYSDSGTFMVQAGLDKSRIVEAIRLIVAELKRAASDGVTKQELEMAKHFIRGRLVLELEDSESVADWYAKQQLMLGKILEPDQRVKKLFAVTEGQIKDVAKKVINTRQLNLALIGPIEDQKVIEKLIEKI